VDSRDRAAAELALAEARSSPGVKVVLWDQLSDPAAVADVVREVAREKGVKATVEVHPNGVVSVAVEAGEAIG
jgi:hypothetical protein